MTDKTNNTALPLSAKIAVAAVVVIINLTSKHKPPADSMAFAAAYLDPSTGSMIISAIVGIVATIALGAKTIWYKTTSLFRPKKKSVSTTATIPAQADAQPPKDHSAGA